MSDPILADDVEPEKVSWLWRERIPRGMITVVAGRPDQGKGLFAVHVGAEISRQGGQVLHSAIEDSHGLMTRPRYEAAGAVLDHVHLWRFQIPAQLRELEHIVIEKNIDLIIMDPFAAHLSPGVSRHSDNVRTVLTPLTEMLEATGAALVIVEHALKRIPANGHPLNAIGGTGLPQHARAAYVLGIDPADEDRRVLCPVKCNIRDWPKALAFAVDIADIPVVGDVPALIYEDEVEFDPMRLFENKKNGVVGRPPDKRAAAAEWLTNYLAAKGKPIRAGLVFEDAKQYGMTAKTLRKAADDMGIVKMPPGGGRTCTWELPDDIKDLLDSGGEPDENDADPTKIPELDDGLKLSDEDLAQLLGQGPITADEVKPGDDEMKGDDVDGND